MRIALAHGPNQTELVLKAENEGKEAIIRAKQCSGAGSNRFISRVRNCTTVPLSLLAQLISDVLIFEM